VNEYTVQIDFKVESLGIWHCFYQTNPQNNNDGDCFINPSGNLGVAATGYSPAAVYTGEWYRLVISVDNGSSYTYYLDGVVINQAVVQEIDGRFSLDSVLLLFADEDGEDNNILISEVSIWDQPLTAAEAASLGGFWHPTPPNTVQLIGHPFLQSMTPESVFICWHDTAADISRVEYGVTTELGSQSDGSSEMVIFPYRWHSVQLTGLMPGTKYYYRVLTGSGNSPVFTFKTIPDDNYNGHLRFLLFSDTQDDSTKTGFVVRNAKQKVMELYGGEPSDHINLMMHTGDIVGSGSDISAWTKEFFMPFAPLTFNLPFLSVAGNHEMEHSNYYTYIKYDSFSAYPPSHPLFEKIWTYRLPGTLFIGMNTNVTGSYGDEQIQWLDQTLLEAESDTSIGFVFCFLHHPPVSEIWGEGNTDYVNYEVLPVLQKYSKVQELCYGHTHAFERGAVESKAENSNGDFRIHCVGGGGGNRDRWGEYTNFDYPQIHIALDHHFYILYDIDLGNATYDAYMFDLGNSDIPATNTAGDQWHRRLNQPAPAAPGALDPTYSQGGLAILHATPFAGDDEIMTSRFQLTSAQGQYESPLLDQVTDWQNIYGTDAYFQPVDLNAGKDISQVEVPAGILEYQKKYYFRVRYRDQNLKWSPWSDELPFTFTGTQGIDTDLPDDSGRLQVIPNPCRDFTVIRFKLSKGQNIRVEIRDILGRLIIIPVNGFYLNGLYNIPLNLDGFTPGVYTCTLITDQEFSSIRFQVSSFR
jgi:hypothetical protein